MNASRPPPPGHLPAPDEPESDEWADETSDAAAGDSTVLEIGREHHHASLFDYLDALYGPLDRPAVRQAAAEGLLRVNDAPAGPSVTLRRGDQVRLELPPAHLARKSGAQVTLLWRDEHFAVADKPSGMPFDASRNGGACALDQLRALCDGLRPRPLHRLDRDTSGLVIAALSEPGAEAGTRAFQEGDARLEYLAVIRGVLPEEDGVMDMALGKGRRSTVTLRPDPEHGKDAATAWRLEERLTGFSVVRLTPEGLGRSHQVRAHLLALGNPALCDRDYQEDQRLLLSQLKLHYRPKRGRPERPLLERPAVHASRFVWSSRGLDLTAPLPEDLSVLLAQLRRLRPLA